MIDSKQYRGRLQLDASGQLWHGRYPLSPALGAVSWEADQAARVLPDPGVVVVPIVAVHGAQVPWGKVVMNGVPVVSARRLPGMLRQLPAVLGPSGSRPWLTRPEFASALLLDSRHTALGDGGSRGSTEAVGGTRDWRWISGALGALLSSD